MLQIKKKLIKFNFNADENNPKFIVIHDTGNTKKGANAEMHYQFFNGGDRQASAHYFVDDKEVIQTVLVKDKAWHCGDGGGKYGIANYNSIGIEMCINLDGDYNRMLENTIELVKYLIKEYRISIDNVVRHYDASRKNCPYTMSQNDWALWKDFYKRIQNNEPPTWKLEGLKHLYENGIITDYEQWKQRIDEPAPVWFVTLLASRILKNK
jgi:N-acetylmuramoyl-L-alanine amidase